MPTYEWLQTMFPHGYSSGNVQTRIPGPRRLYEEILTGANYRRIFREGLLPRLRPSSRVLELGPGKGSWTRAILEHIPHGELHVVDFQDVKQWLHPERYAGRLQCHKVTNNSFDCLEDGKFDVFWSFGVLCHNNGSHIAAVLKNSLPKMRVGGVAIHQYGDWGKLDRLGWARRYGVPTRFQKMSDDEIWWPRNDQQTMQKHATDAGWEVVTPDLGLMTRDSVIVLRRPG